MALSQKAQKVAMSAIETNWQALDRQSQRPADDRTSERRPLWPITIQRTSPVRIRVLPLIYRGKENYYVRRRDGDPIPIE